MTLNGLLGIVSLKTELFITATVGISNPATENVSNVVNDIDVNIMC
jgi:hypothetical protein